MDAKNKGWISIYRGTNEHPIFKDKSPVSRFEAWVLILMNVNHSDEKVLLGNRLHVCRRGESLRSVGTWANMFRWNITTTRRYFDLLKSDSMIEYESVGNSTRLKVCKYDSYQASRTIDEQSVNNSRTIGEQSVNTNNNVNNDNNENKVIKKRLEERKKDFALALQPYVEKYGRDMINKFYKHWTAHNPNDRKMAFELSKTGKFYIANRLATWKQNESKFNSPKRQTQTTSKIETVLNAFEDVSKLYQ